MHIARLTAILSLLIFLGLGLGAQGQPSPGAAPPAAQGATQNAALGAASTAPALDAQEEGRSLLRSFAPEPRELDQIEALLAADEDALAKARAEIQIAQARLARLMLDQNVDMAQVREIVKSSLDWELQVRLIKIGRQLAVRKIVGDERWAAMFKMSRYLGVLERTGRLRSELGLGGSAAAAGPAAERRARLIALLLRLN